MTEMELKQYRILVKNIADLEKRIETERNREVECVAGVVKGSAKEFPYGERRFGVTMEDAGESSKKRMRIAKWEKEKKECQEQVKRIQQYIEDVPDVQIRMILREYIIDGQRQMQIARKLHMDQSRVSRKLCGFFKNT